MLRDADVVDDTIQINLLLASPLMGPRRVTHFGEFRRWWSIGVHKNLPERALASFPTAAVRGAIVVPPCTLPYD